MFLQLKDALLEISDLPHIVAVGAFCDEAEVARLVALVDIDAVEFQLGLVPAFKGDEVRQKLRAICAPRRINLDATASVVLVAFVVRVVAAVEAGGYTVAETPPVILVRADVCVTEPLLRPLPCFALGAAVAARSRAAPDVMNVHAVRPISARALDQNCPKTASRTKVEPNDFKLADPVADARARKFG